MKGLLIPIMLTVAFAGCSSTNVSDMVKALGQDPASVCVNVTSVYGTLRVARTNLVNGTVVCNGEGLTVKSEATMVGVPLQVVPQISVAPPTLTPPK